MGSSTEGEGSTVFKLCFYQSYQDFDTDFKSTTNSKRLLINKFHLYCCMYVIVVILFFSVASLQKETCS